LRAPFLCLLLTTACAAPEAGRGRPGTVAAEALRALEGVPSHLAEQGPLGWVDLCDDAPDFCMASEGELKFPSHAALREAMAAFGPTVARMRLSWIDPRVDPLSTDLAGFATGYDELLVLESGEELRFGGHVTGVLRRTPGGWRIARLHWSMRQPGR
jgi:hypothetical protein